MKTIRYIKVDNYFVFEKFDRLPVDPAMTQLANKSAIESSTQYEAVESKISKKNGLQKKRLEIIQKARGFSRMISNPTAILDNAKSEEEKHFLASSIAQAPNSLEEQKKKLQNQESLISACDDELRQAGKEFEIKRREVIAANPIFSHPRRNEIEISDEQRVELMNIISSLTDEAVVLHVETREKVVVSDGEKTISAPFPVLTGYEKISDLRGKQYFWHDGVNWQSSDVIEKIGVKKEDVAPPEAIEMSELMEDQAEQISIQAMTAEEKMSEKELQLNLALRAATVKRSELEIQADPESLSKAQTWYNEQVAIIEEKYK